MGKMKSVVFSPCDYSKHFFLGPICTKDIFVFIVLSKVIKIKRNKLEQEQAFMLMES